MATGAYFPEGSYWIHREMFKNETAGSTFVNFVKADDPILTSNTAGLSDTARIYAACVGPANSGTLTHKARMATYVNDFRQEYIAIMGLFDGQDPPDAGDYVLIEYRNSAGVALFYIALVGDGSVEINIDGTVVSTAAAEVTMNELHEFKVEYSGSNDSFRTFKEVRIYIDGIEYCLNAALNQYGAFDDVNYYNRLTVGQNNYKPDYYYIELIIDADAYGVFTYDSWKNSADMTGFDQIPFKEVIVLSNDLATFIPIGANVQDYRLDEQINAIAAAELSIRSEDTVALIADHVTKVKDNSQYNFMLNAEIRIFMQISKIVSEGETGSVPGIPTEFVDLNADFVADGVKAGDWFYSWNANGNHNRPRQITTVNSATKITLDIFLGAGAVTLQNYTIVRGHERYWDRYLGDYRFIGRFLEYELGYAPGESIIPFRCFDYGYHMTQKRLWCPTTKYYYKDLDRILRGWPTEQLLVGFATQDDTGVIIGGNDYNYQYGIINPSIFKPLYDRTHIAVTEALYTFVFRRNDYIYDALKKVLNDGAWQYTPFYDMENASQIYLWFRDFKDKTTEKTTSIKTGNVAVTNIIEDVKIGLNLRAKFGIKSYVDYTYVDGNRSGLNTGDLISAQYPDIIPDSTTREAYESDEYIWQTNQAQARADALYRDLHRIVPDGTIKTEYFPQRDTWEISDTMTWADHNQEEYPGGPIINHLIDQTRPLDGSSGNSSTDATKHSQGDCYRRPFNRLGETGTLFLDAVWEEDYTITQMITEYGPRGYYTTIRPELRLWSDIIAIADNRRDIDRIAQNFVDPDISECSLLMPKEVTGITDYVGVGLVPAEIISAIDIGGGLHQAQIDFDYFKYTDEVSPATAYSYCLYYRASGGGVGTPWVALPLGISAVNEITDIDDSTIDIILNNALNGEYGHAGGNNFVIVQLPGAGTYDVMIELRVKFVTTAGDQYIQRAIPPNPPDTAMPAGDELIETLDSGGESLSNGLIALIDWDAVTVA